MSEAAQRAAVLAAARGWLGTPFHDTARVKGAGVDCAQLLAAVAYEAGIVPAPVETPPYGPQWMLHRDEPLFETEVRRYAHEIEAGAVRPADIVLYKIGRSYAHGAFVVEWPRAIIHAFKPYGFVAETGGDEGQLRGRAVRFFSMW